MTARPLICEPGKPTIGWWYGVASPTPWTDAGPGESKPLHSVLDLAALGLVLTYRLEVVQTVSVALCGRASAPWPAQSLDLTGADLGAYPPPIVQVR
jgi:hypothetical protein